MNVNFSIIMPNYNSRFLERAINSVTQQSYDKWELIIIDNFSSNNPENIINNINDERIFFSKFSNNNNIAKSRNYGISKSKYEWIAFLDSDDVWKKDKLLIVKSKIENINPDFLHHGMYYLPQKKVIADKSKEIKKPIFKSLLVEGNGIANSSVIVKKDLLQRINFLSEDERKFSWEDYDCWLRCSQITNNFYFIPEILGYCWDGEGRVSNNYQSYKNCKNFMKIYQEELKNNAQFFKKRPKWISRLYSNYYFKNKSFLRAYYFLINSNDNKIKTILKISYLYLLTFIIKNIFKELRKIKNFFKTKLNRVIIYSFDSENIENQQKLLENTTFRFCIFRKYKELRNINNFFCSFDNREFLKRFRKNHKMVALLDEENKMIACYGWNSDESPHQIDEINKKFLFNKGSILYDFKTLSAYKNKKLYKLLLNKITLNIEKPLYIYSLSENKFSISAILNSGFKLLTKLNFLSNDFDQKNY